MNLKDKIKIYKIKKIIAKEIGNHDMSISIKDETKSFTEFKVKYYGKSIIVKYDK